MSAAFPRKLSKSERAAALDPVAFQQTWLGRRLWSVEQQLARAVTMYPLVAVKGCHASGKSWTAAGMPLFHLNRYEHSLCFTTSPTLRQVKTFWKEVYMAWDRGRIKSLMPEPNTTSLELSKERYAFGASSSSGVNIQGPHAENLLIIADEAPGIEPDVWDAMEGMRAGGNVHMLAMGNPVVPSGAFYDMFTRGRATYKLFSISAFDTPNLHHEQTGKPLTFEDLLTMPEDRLDYAPYPFLITRRWVKERYQVWGPNHPKFRSRVMAEFPEQSPYAVFELGWIERAKREATEKEIEASVKRGALIQCGLDVAGPGDDETVLTARVNGMILGQWAWNVPDPRGLVAVQLGDLRRHPRYRMGQVVVDITGIGYHFATHLADLGFQVYGFQAGSRPMDTTAFVNLKSEAYFACRSYFREGLISGLADEECEAQLCTLQYRENSRGLTEIESKEEARKRGLPSPDRAESLIMAFMKIVPREQHVERTDHYVRISPI